MSLLSKGTTSRVMHRSFLYKSYINLAFTFNSYKIIQILEDGIFCITDGSKVNPAFLRSPLVSSRKLFLRELCQRILDNAICFAPFLSYTIISFFTSTIPMSSNKASRKKHLKKFASQRIFFFDDTFSLDFKRTF